MILNICFERQNNLGRPWSAVGRPLRFSLSFFRRSQWNSKKARESAVRKQAVINFIDA